MVSQRSDILGSLDGLNQKIKCQEVQPRHDTKIEIEYDNLYDLSEGIRTLLSTVEPQLLSNLVDVIIQNSEWLLLVLTRVVDKSHPLNEVFRNEFQRRYAIALTRMLLENLELTEHEIAELLSEWKP